MKLGKRADYAIRAVLGLARRFDPNTLIKSREIAAEKGISAKYLPQLLATLVRAGLVESETGPHGGYRLAVPPDMITLLEVIEAIEGPLQSVECILNIGPCKGEGVCAMHEPWARAQAAMRSNLARTTFGDLIIADAAIVGRQRSGA